MTLLAPDAKPRWRSFLEDVVSDEVQRIVSGQTNHLELKFHQIQAFDPDFADILLLQPDHILRGGIECPENLLHGNGLPATKRSIHPSQ